MMGPGRASKRSREDDIAEHFWSEKEDSGVYLTVKLQSGKPLKEKGWPWVQQCIRGILGGSDKVDKANFLNDGRLLVKTKDPAQTTKLLRVHMFGGEDCTVERDDKLNQSRGTINATDLMDLSEEEVVGWLADFGVVAAKRFTRRVGAHTEKTPIILLTFNKPTCPMRLELDYIVYKVKQHIPNPLICLQCGKFGHVQARCRSEPKCLTCGAAKHEGECSKKCMHCGDTEHDCLSKQCPMWTKEKRICEIKVTKDVSYSHARHLYAKETPEQTTRSYAAMTRTTSEATADPSLKMQMAAVEQKLDKMISLLDRFLQFQMTAEQEPVDRQNVEQRGQEAEQSGTEQSVNSQVTDSPPSPPDKENTLPEQDNSHILMDDIDSQSQPITQASQEQGSLTTMTPSGLSVLHNSQGLSYCWGTSKHFLDRRVGHILTTAGEAELEG